MEPFSRSWHDFEFVVQNSSHEQTSHFWPLKLKNLFSTVFTCFELKERWRSKWTFKLKIIKEDVQTLVQASIVMFWAWRAWFHVEVSKVKLELDREKVFVNSLLGSQHQKSFTAAKLFNTTVERCLMLNESNERSNTSSAFQRPLTAKIVNHRQTSTSKQIVPLHVQNPLSSQNPSSQLLSRPDLPELPPQPHKNLLLTPRIQHHQGPLSAMKTLFSL